MSPSFSNVIEALRHWNSVHPEKVAFQFETHDGSTPSLTYRELTSRTLAFGNELLKNSSIDDRILILLPPGLNFVTTILSCLVARRIAVPAYPPASTNPEHSKKIFHIIEDCLPKVIVCLNEHKPFLREYLNHHPDITLMSFSMPETPADVNFPPIQDTDLAFLQYTSGSTSSPKGVKINHKNLKLNIEAQVEEYTYDPQTWVVNWIPPFHDMGLIGGIFTPLYFGYSAYLMAPMTFLLNPIKWLRAVSSVNAPVLSAAPNFAFDHCVGSIKVEKIQELDLSQWKVCCNGAEPIRKETIENFIAKFSPFGFKRNTFYCCYGMAETTLIISGRGHRSSPRYIEKKGLHYVSCGTPRKDHEIMINASVGEVGEILVKGPCVSDGYWNKNDPIKNEGGFFPTGDLGFLDEGELFVTGRCKEIIIYRGQKFYPADIELLLGELAECRKNLITVIQLSDMSVAVVIEQQNKSQRLKDLPLSDISELITRSFGIKELSFYLLPPKKTPKTSSGKKRRVYLAEILSSLSLESLTQDDKVTKPSLTQDEVLLSIKEYLIDRKLLDPESWSPDLQFDKLPFDSLLVTDFLVHLEKIVGERVSHALIFECATPKALATSLRESLTDSKISQVSVTNHGPLSVVGLSCRLPGSENILEFKNLLFSNSTAISHYSKFKDWSVDDSNFPCFGGYIRGIHEFDAEAFSLSREEVQNMDPQQRLLLEEVWKAIQSSGLDPSTLAGQKVGVFVGASSFDNILLDETDPSSFHSALGNSHSMLANRISHFFDFKGPSLAIDTACSSSLVALHYATLSLNAQDCDIAIVAGVNLIQSDLVTQAFFKANLLAKDPSSVAFSDNSHGYIRGEGLGVVILKRTKEIEAHDYEYAQIEATAVNQDGQTRPITAPSSLAQNRVIRAALSKVPEERLKNLKFIEAHGTATQLGDSIEYQVLQKITQDYRLSGIKLTTVKNKIGHLESAAGIAGLIKSIICLKIGKLPIHEGFKGYNPLIRVSDSLSIVQEPHELPQGRNLCGISSFGFGGTNSHVILSAETDGKLPWSLPKALRPILIERSSKAKHRTTRSLEELEGEISSYIAQFLGENSVSSEKNFYDLGLDSLNIIDLLNEMNSRYQISVRLADVIDSVQSIRSFAQFLHLRLKEVDQSDNPHSQVTLLKREILTNTPGEVDRPGLINTQLLNEISHWNKLTPSSKAFAAQSRSEHADNRASAGFRPQSKDGVYLLLAKEANGCKIIDEDGNEFLDFSMGFGVHLFGYNPEFLTKPLGALLSTSLYLGPIDRTSLEVAKKIAFVSRQERVAFTNSGTEAVMTALKLARAFHTKGKTIVFEGSYHGHYDGVLGRGHHMKDGYETIPYTVGINKSAVQDLIVLPYNDESSLNFISENIHDIAAVLVEPIQSRYPEVRPQAFLAKLREITKDKSALIFDEIVTGFRISLGGVQEEFGIDPDITLYGKIIGGGLPIGVIAGKAKYLNHIDGGPWQYGDDSKPESELTFFAGTFCKHPLTMAAASLTLDKLIAEKELIYPQLNSKVQRMASELNEFFESIQLDFRMVFYGSLFRFKGKVNLEMFYFSLYNQKIWVWEGRNFFLSTAHSDEDIARFIEVVRRIAPSLKLEDNKRLLTPFQRRFFTKDFKFPEEALASNFCFKVKFKNKLVSSKIVLAFEELKQLRPFVKNNVSPTGNTLSTNVNPLKIVEEKAQFDSLISERLSANPRELLSSPNIIFLIDEEESLLFFESHTSSLDGYGSMHLMGDLLTLYQGGEVLPITWERELESSVTSKQNILFWQEELSSLGTTFYLKKASDFNAGRFIKETPLLNTHDYSIFVTLLARFVSAISEIYRVDELVLMIPFNTRKTAEEMRLYSNQTTLLPVLVKDIKSLTFDDLLKICSQKTHQAMIHGDISYGDLREISKKKISTLFFNVEPSLTGLKDYEILPLERKHLLYEISVNITIGKQLTFSIDYDSSSYSEEEVHQIIHCMTKGRT